MKWRWLKPVANKRVKKDILKFQGLFFWSRKKTKVCFFRFFSISLFESKIKKNCEMKTDSCSGRWYVTKKARKIAKQKARSSSSYTRAFNATYWWSKIWNNLVNLLLNKLRFRSKYENSKPKAKWFSWARVAEKGIIKDIGKPIKEISAR